MYTIEADRDVIVLRRLARWRGLGPSTSRHNVRGGTEV